MNLCSARKLPVPHWPTPSKRLWLVPERKDRWCSFSRVFSFVGDWDRGPTVNKGDRPFVDQSNSSSTIWAVARLLGRAHTPRTTFPTNILETLSHDFRIALLAN